MAPKGGGKGGGGGGGGKSRGGCSNCTKPLTLYGYGWENETLIALLAIDVVVAFVLLVCLILQSRFKWVKDLSVDKLRNTGYSVAASALLISYIFYIVDIALREEQETVTYLYYITFVISNGLWRLADILILGIVFRTIAESSISNLARKLSALHKVLVIVLASISLVAFGFYIALTVDLIRGSYSTSEVTTKGYKYISVAYYAIYLVSALLAGLESVLVLLRARSKATLIMVGFVTPALILHSLFTLVNYVITTYSHIGEALNWACVFISEITNIFIYLGIVLIGWFTFRKGASRSGKYVGGTANGQYVGDTSYKPVDNWGR